MAKEPKLINQVIDLLGEGKSTKEITDETGCSKSTVTVARKKMAAKVKADADKANQPPDPTEDEMDEAIDSFIKRVKITPDPDVIDDDDERTDDEDYECPKCGHEWSASKDENQDECPSCGVEFQ